ESGSACRFFQKSWPLSRLHGALSHVNPDSSTVPEKEPPMQLFSWLHKRLTGRPQTRPTPGRKPTLQFRPQLEVLARRDLPSFASPVAIGSYYMATLVTADANGDGKPDLLTSPSAGNAGTQWLNNGNGTFVQGRGLFDWGQPTPTAMAVGDVNGDGKLDFVFAN